jgi:hypothetical protein
MEAIFGNKGLRLATIVGAAILFYFTENNSGGSEQW